MKTFNFNFIIKICKFQIMTLQKTGQRTKFVSFSNPLFEISSVKKVTISTSSYHLTWKSNPIHQGGPHLEEQNRQDRKVSPPNLPSMEILKKKLASALMQMKFFHIYTRWWRFSIVNCSHNSCNQNQCK